MADPTGLQSRVKKMIREYRYKYTSMADNFVCDERPRVTVIMSTQVS